MQTLGLNLGQVGVALLLVLGGAGLTLQAAVNARLRGAVGSPVLGALISFLVGAVPLALAAAGGLLGRGRLSGLGGQPWWMWIGGLFGAFYVTLAIIGVPRVGAAVVVACAVGGQLLAALVLDSQGWLGVPRAPLNPWRVLGVLLVFAGVLLVQHKK
jgi:transporter family-2 protein